MIHRLRRAVVECAGRLAEEATACRECRRRVSFLSKICRHCGAGNPVRIPVSPSVVVTVFGSQLAIIFLKML